MIDTTQDTQPLTILSNNSAELLQQLKTTQPGAPSSRQPHRR